MFLAEYRENKICMSLGKKFQLALGPLAEAFTQELSASYRYF
jgi:hypothetical protein